MPWEALGVSLDSQLSSIFSILFPELRMLSNHSNSKTYCQILLILTNDLCFERKRNRKKQRHKPNKQKALCINMSPSPYDSFDNVRPPPPAPKPINIHHALSLSNEISSFLLCLISLSFSICSVSFFIFIIDVNTFHLLQICLFDSGFLLLFPLYSGIV